MRRLHPNGFSVADDLLIAFVNLGRLLTPETRILDYGCGDGGLVYELRAWGYDARGFDIHDRVNYRQPGDRSFFGFIDNPVKDTSNQTVDAKTFRLPWESDTFDVIVSTSVIEHVLDLAPVMAEIARVLKPSGFSWHLYPKKSIPIEPHIYVPFGSRIQNWWYFYFWALLGVRNEFQGHMTARQTADNNLRYCQTGLRYYTEKELFDICGRYFQGVQFVDRLYYCTENPKDARANKVKAMRAEYPLRAMARTFKLGVLLTDQKISNDQAVTVATS